jgi:hypothetical protein
MPYTYSKYCTPHLLGLSSPQQMLQLQHGMKDPASAGNSVAVGVPEQASVYDFSFLNLCSTNKVYGLRQILATIEEEIKKAHLKRLLGPSAVASTTVPTVLALLF